MQNVFQRNIFTLAVSLALGGVAVAQGPLDAVPMGLPPSSEIHYDLDHEGTHWVRGATYKASFSGDGATYVPFLGPEAPQNYPVRMTLVEASVGGVGLELAQPKVTREEDRMTIDRGSVRAEYLLGAEFVEQLFLLDAKPSGPGDLVVRLDVETELLCHAHGKGLTYRNPLGGVDYGAAFVLDAAGHRLPLAMDFDQSSIRLRVPSSFLEAATFPIAVDPLLSTVRLTQETMGLLHPDVVWDPVEQRYLVVAELAFSASDHDVVSFFATPTGAQSGGYGYIDISTTYCRGPQVAAIPDARVACVVFSSGFAGSRDIWYRMRNLASGSLATGMPLTQGPLDEFRPDVGGVALTESTYQRFTVVFERRDSSVTHSIVSTQVVANGAALGINYLVRQVSGVKAQAPAISSSIPLGQLAHNVVWYEGNASSSRIVTRQSHAYGYNLTTSPTVVTSSSSEQRNPDVTALGPRIAGETDLGYGIVWQSRFGGDAEVRMALCVRDQVVTTTSLERMENAVVSHYQSQPAIASSGDGFAVAYIGAPSSSAEHDLFLCGLSATNRSLAIAERRVVASVGPGHNETPRVVSHYEVGGVNNGFGPFAAVFTQRDPASSGSTLGDLRLAVYETERACGVQDAGCTGNPNSTGVGAMIAIFGSATNLAPRTVRVDGLPTQAVGLLLASQTSDVAVVGGSMGVICLGGEIGRFYPPVHSGSSGVISTTLDPMAIPQPTGIVAAMAGETWRLQLWHRDVGVGMPTSNFSNAAKIVFE